MVAGLDRLIGSVVVRYYGVLWARPLSLVSPFYTIFIFFFVCFFFELGNMPHVCASTHK